MPEPHLKLQTKIIGEAFDEWGVLIYTRPPPTLLVGVQARHGVLDTAEPPAEVRAGRRGGGTPSTLSWAWLEFPEPAVPTQADGVQGSLVALALSWWSLA